MTVGPARTGSAATNGSRRCMAAQPTRRSGSLSSTRVPRVRRDWAISGGLAIFAFSLALAQRWGLESSDTKIDLHVDPVSFLGDVAAAWSPTYDLGHVQGGQYGGYLLPMGPFFALGRLIGLSPWLVQRLWLGLVLAL